MRTRGVAMEIENEVAREATLQLFSEAEEVLDLIRTLPSVVSDLRVKEVAEQRFIGRT